MNAAILNHTKNQDGTSFLRISSGSEFLCSVDMIGYIKTLVFKMHVDLAPINLKYSKGAPVHSVPFRIMQCKLVLSLNIFFENECLALGIIGRSHINLITVIDY